MGNEKRETRVDGDSRNKSGLRKVSRRGKKRFDNGRVSRSSSKKKATPQDAELDNEVKKNGASSSLLTAGKESSVTTKEDLLCRSMTISPADEVIDDREIQPGKSDEHKRTPFESVSPEIKKGSKSRTPRSPVLFPRLLQESGFLGEVDLSSETKNELFKVKTFEVRGEGGQGGSASGGGSQGAAGTSK